MARTTFGSKEIISKRGFLPGQVTSYNMSTAAIGLSASATGLERQMAVVKFGQILAATSRQVFVAPASGAKIVSARVGFDVLVYHHATAANMWIFNLRNESAANNLVKNNASLSGVSVAATGFKVLPINNGNSSLNAFAGLRLVATASGTAQTLTNVSAYIEWIPLNNA